MRGDRCGCACARLRLFGSFDRSIYGFPIELQTCSSHRIVEFLTPGEIHAIEVRRVQEAGRGCDATRSGKAEKYEWRMRGSAREEGDAKMRERAMQDEFGRDGAGRSLSWTNGGVHRETAMSQCVFDVKNGQEGDQKWGWINSPTKDRDRT
jgi:hypothetical protein